MVSIVAPSLWQKVYELGVTHGHSGMFYYWMALVQGAKLLLSFVFLHGVDQRETETKDAKLPAR